MLNIATTRILHASENTSATRVDVEHEEGVSDRAAVRTSEPGQAYAPGSYDPASLGSVPSKAPAVDDVLDVEGATRLLRIGRNTVYELVGRNEIPHRRLGKQIRFSRAAIMRWLDSWSLQGVKERQ